jgi:TetR/AcrR family transcriptional regulator
MSRPRHLLNPVQTAQPETDTRKRILKAALTEFAQYGLAGARVERIARRARVNKAMIYYHFSSKKALHKETVKEHFAALLTEVSQSVTVSGQFEDVLKALAEVYAAAFSDKPEFAKILIRELADSKSGIVELLADTIIKSGLPKQIVTSFQVGIRQESFRPVDIRQAFVSFMLMNIGYFVLTPFVDRVWGITNRRRFIAEHQEAVIDLFLYGVKKR